MTVNNANLPKVNIPQTNLYLLSLTFFFFFSCQYLEAQLQYKLLNRIKSQLLELLRGFYDVVPEPLLSVFDFQGDYEFFFNKKI
jgi:hypothetical protein